jgi:hypothetical protein
VLHLGVLFRDPMRLYLVEPVHLFAVTYLSRVTRHNSLRLPLLILLGSLGAYEVHLAGYHSFCIHIPRS